MRRWHLTEREKREIARLALRGLRASQIGRKLGVTRGTVCKFLNANSLPHGWPKLTEGQKDAVTFCCCLGVSHRMIAEKLGFSFHHVRLAAIERQLPRPDGAPYGTTWSPRGDIAGFTEAIKGRDDRIRNLQRKFGLGIEKANQLAHEILDTREFRPGLSQPPLSSIYPQKHHRQSLKLTERPRT